jgi:tRNA dimethylallyltransferase
VKEGITCEKERFQELNIVIPLEQKLLHDVKQKKKKVILLAGPTGSGKTALSFILAQNLDNCEIISADSMQVYRGMDIGTAKATPEQLSQVPHHLIDIRHVSEPFNVVDFYYEARHCMESILSRGNCPIVVGGAGFYFRALLYGPPSGPPSIPIVRKALEEEMEILGIDALFSTLQQKDPEYSATITRGDRHKIIRALEIITLTREPVSKFSWKCRTPPCDYDYRCWFVYRPRDSLYKSIEQRCDRMLQEGL